jgi:hypothetical protein
MLIDPASARNRNSHNEHANLSRYVNTDSSQSYPAKQPVPSSSVAPSRKQSSQAPYSQSSQSGHKSVTKDPALPNLQISKKRVREEEEGDNDDIDMSESEMTANMMADRRALGKKGRPKAVPGERNKNVQLSKSGLGGAEVYESLMTLVCAELVRRRLSLKGWLVAYR